MPQNADRPLVKGSNDRRLGFGDRDHAECCVQITELLAQRRVERERAIE